MAKANINDRTSIEKIYGADLWERDATRNAQGSASIVHGVKILSEPDNEGSFELAPASQHVGEGDPEGDSLFIPAFEADAAAAVSGSTYAGGVSPTENGNNGSDYSSFIDGVIEAARKIDFKPPIGVGEERIKGFRGG